jgi:hypothetical protein
LRLKRHPMRLCVSAVKPAISSADAQLKLFTTSSGAAS